MKTLFLLIFLCCLYTLKAQTNFLPGYIITNDNDTLHGLIDYRSNAQNCRRCEFRESENAPSRVFLPLSIKGYRFNDGKFYVSKTLHTDSLTIPVFMEYLVNGISSLYYYPNNTNPNYYLENKDGQLYQLTSELRQVHENGHDYFIESKTYIGMLRIAFADCPQIYPLINTVKLEDKSLIAITKKYHDYVCDGEKCIIYEKQLPVVKFTFGAFIGMEVSTIKFYKSPTYENVHFNSDSYPTIGLLTKASLPRISDKLSFQASGEYSKASFYGTGIRPGNGASERVSIHLSMVKVKTSLKYTWPKGTIRPTLLAGLHLMKPLSTDALRIESFANGSDIAFNKWKDVPFANRHLGYQAEAGIDYHRPKGWTPFLTLGFEQTSGNADSEYSPAASTSIFTITAHTGIYF